MRKTLQLFYVPAVSAVLLLLASGGALRAQSGPGTGATTEFDVCDGTYALCTSAKCNSSYSCACEVVYKGGKPNYSVGAHQAGTNACTGISKAAPVVGAQIPSRYYPITGYATCTNTRTWAWCLDMSCTIANGKLNGKDTLVAQCACTAPPVTTPPTPTQPYIAVPLPGKAPAADACTSGVISSATVVDANAVTLWLLNHSTPIKPVNPVQVWAVPQK